MNLFTSFTACWPDIRNLAALCALSVGLIACELGADNTNVQPIASAGNDIPIDLSPDQRNAGANLTATLNGNGRDNDGSVVSYLWEVVSSTDPNLVELVNIEQPEQAKTNVSLPPLDARYKLQLTVTDDKNESDADLIYISVGTFSSTDPNLNIAVVTTNPDQSVISGEKVLLEATKDNFSGPVRYQWRRISAIELGYDLDDKETRIASFIAPEVTEPQQFVFEVVAFSDTQIARSTTKVTVSPDAAAVPNVKPIANAGPDQLAQPGELVILRGLGSDIDGEIVRYNWTQPNANNSSVELLNADTAEASFIAPDVTSLTPYSFSLQVYDNDGDLGEDTAIISIKPNPTAPKNSAPLVQAGPNKTVNENSVVNLTGTATDIDGSIASYIWQQIGGPVVVLQSANSPSSNFTAPTVSQDTDLTFQLSATDDLGAVGVDITVVTVTPLSINIPPIANAGVDTTVSEGTSVTLVGNGNDSDGAIVSFLWSQVPTGTPTVTLQSANTDTVSFIAPSVSQVTTLTLELRVTDNRDAPATDIVLVTVNPVANATPVSIAGPNQAVNEGDQVTLSGSGTDSDGTITGYQWNLISGPGINLLSATSASTTFTAPNVTQVTALTLELVVTDNSGAKASSTLVVTVSPINTAPVANAGIPQIVASGATVLISGSGTDSDGTITGYQWTQTAGPTISLANPQAASTSFNAPNVTQATDISLQLTVTDNNGASATDLLLVTVSAANIPPVANAGADRTATSGDVISITGVGSDNDGTVVGFSWSQLSGPALVLGTTSLSTLTFNAPAVTQTSTISLLLTVTDNSGGTGTDIVNIIVNPGNLPPIVSAGSNTTAFSGDLVSITGTGSDSDGVIVSYRWVVLSGPSVILLNANTNKVTFTAPSVTQADIVTLELTVTDDKNATAVATVDITISPASNILPIANAGLDMSVTNGNSITITGSGTDSDGTITDYLWVQTLGPSVILLNANTPSVSFTSPNVTVDTQIALTLTVTDNNGATAVDGMIVTVLASSNAVPSASAGIDKTVTSGNSITITGTATDSDGSITNRLWTQISGPTVALSNATTASTTFVAPTVGTATDITLQFTATDNSGATASDSMIVTVLPLTNALPVANAGVDRTVSSSNSVSITGSGTDSDGSITSYQWAQTSGGAVALSNADTATVSFIAPTVTATTTLTLQLTVTDNSGATATDAMVVTVVTSTNAIPVADAGADRFVSSGNSITLTGSGTDSDGTISSYSWTQTAGPTVNLGNNNLATISFTAPAVTVSTSITLLLTVTDNGGASATDFVILTITPITNAVPVANAGPDQNAVIGGNVLLNGSGTDSDGTITGYEWIQLGGPPVILINATTANASFIAPTVAIATPLSFQLTVTDNQQATGNDIIVVTVAPAAANLTPVAIAGADVTVASGSNVVVPGSGTDSDGIITAYLWTQTGGPTVSLINATTATVSFTAPSVTVATAISLQLTVTDDKAATGTDTIIINVSPGANVLPVANAGLDRTVDEGTTVTLTGSGTDTDGTISTYNWTQLSGPTVTLINANTATLSFVAPQVASQSIVALQLSVTDNSGGVATDPVNITVMPVNNPPTANAGLDLTVLEQSIVTVTGSGSDVDGTISSYLWTQLNGPTVALINANTAITTFTAPTVTQITTLSLQLTVTDNQGASATDAVIIIVDPINTLPTANAGVDQTVTQGATVTLNGSGTDPDGTISSYAWTQTAGTPLVNLTGANTASATFLAPAVTVQSTISLQLVVTDNGGATASDIMLVTINPGNIPPIADAGSGINVDSAATVVISGLPSRDPDGTIVSYLWTQIPSVTPVTLLNANTATVQFVAPTVAADPAIIFLQLTVTDNQGATDTTTIFVSAFPPTTLSGRISTSVNNMVDSDINDLNTIPISNNDTVTAQQIVNPVVLGGYVNLPLSGAAGNSFTTGDSIDVFHISLNANQSVTLYVGHPVTGINELGLELLDLNGAVVAASMGGTAVENVTATTAGNYFIRVTAQAGASNYILTVGAAPLQVQSNGWTLVDDYIAGDVIVEFVNGSSILQSSLASRANSVGLQAKAGAAGRSMLMGLNRDNKASAFAKLAVKDIARITAVSALQSKLDTLLAAAALRQRKDVKSVRLNYRYYINQVPNDPNYNIQWHYPSINLPLAWDTTTGSSNVIVAVVDTGVLLDHPDLSQAGKLVPGYDFIRSDANSNDGQPGIDPDPYDVGDGGGQVASSFHGTHVSGTVAASSNNGIGVAGVAWGVKIMPLRVIGLNGGSSYDIEQAIRFAARLANDSGTLPAQKADVINLSLGGPANSIIAPAAYSQARAANVIIVASAGNSATSAPSAPAAYNGVVSVSATNISKQLASYSNFGSTIDVAAPGGSSGDINGDGFQDRVFSTGGNDSSGTVVFNYNLKMGTSMSAPHVSGVVALMKSVFPAMTPDDFDTMLFNGSLTQDLGAVGRDNSFGYGLIDAAKAVAAAQAAAGTAPPPAQPPILSVTPTVLSYGVGLVSSDIVVQNTGAGTLSIASVTNNSTGWLNVAPLSVDNNGLGTYTVTVNRIGLVDGNYTAIITIASALSGSVTVSVSMQVSSTNLQVNAGPQTIELLDANTSNIIDSLKINPLNGFYDFTFNNVRIGPYTIRSGSDLDNDGIICELGESCGAYPILDGTGTNVIDVNGNSPVIINLDFETGFRITLPAQ